MIPVRFRRSAQQDIQKAFDYFEAQSAGLGAEFLERVEDAADRISDNPYTYQTVFHDVRRADLKKFRYGLFYRVEDDGSVVVACLAHRQDWFWRGSGRGAWSRDQETGTLLGGRSAPPIRPLMDT